VRHSGGWEDDVGNWSARVAGAFHTIQRAASGFARRKVKSTPFGEKNGKVPFNASGVTQVGQHRFVFVDNHDPAALFELVLDDDDAEAERIARRPLAGVAGGALRDPEGLARVDVDGEILLVVASSLCAAGTNRSDGLVRARYTRHGDLHAEPMVGFRAWLLRQLPSLAMAGEREPDAGGLNIEGLAWDSRAGALLFGLRGPAEPGEIALIRISVDVAAASWTTSSLGPPSIVRARVPKSTAIQGIRDISYDEETGDFLILVGRSTSGSDAPFQLGTWNGSSDKVRLLDVAFHRSMKPEGVTTFRSGDKTKILIIDDGGGYAVLDHPGMDQ
jgi:hypothetical protein